MPTTKELFEKRAPIAKAILQLRDAAKDRDFTPEEQANWDRMNTDYNAINREIERNKITDAVDAEQKAAAHPEFSHIGRADYRPAAGQPAGEVTENHRALALSAWCRSERKALDQASQEACRLTGLNPYSQELVMPLYSTADMQALQRQYRQYHAREAVERMGNFKATLTIGSGPAGGYLIPPETMVRNLEINMLAFGGVRQVAETIRTTGGERMGWPGADDTSNTGAQLGESTSIGSSVDPSFVKVYWDAYKFSSKAILVPYELIEDSAFNLPALLGQMQGERLGRITNTKFTTGTGAATPKGIVTAATAFSAASATAISWDDVLGLEHSIDPAYRIGASYMMHDSILLACRKLKDGNAQYLWQNGISVGEPDRFNGQPLTNNQDMDSTISSGKKTILYGQLFKYKIRSVGVMRMYRLEERYRDTDQDGFIAFIREDGNLLNVGTAPVKYLSH